MKKFTCLLISAWLLLLGAVGAQAFSILPPTLPLLTQNAEVTVEAFGAKGDGTSDDTAAINAAIASPARIIRFAAKTYRISVAYQSGQASANKRGIQILASGKTLRGAGADTIIKALPAASGITFTITQYANYPSQPPAYNTNGVWSPVIWGSSVSNCTVENLQVDGLRASQINFTDDCYTNPQTFALSNQLSSQGILFYLGDKNTVKNCIVHDTQGYGIDFWDSSNGRMEACKGYLCGMASMATHTLQAGAGTLGRGTVISHCEAYNNYCDNIRIETQECTVEYCHSHDSRVNPYAGIRGEGNVAGIYIEQPAKRTHLVGNKCHDNASYGIDTGSSTEGIISNNECYNNGNGGIQIAGNYNSVCNNVCSDNGKTLAGFSDDQNASPFGISVFSGKWNTFSGNMLRSSSLNTQTWGISYIPGLSSSIQSCIFTNNIIIGHTGGVIRGNDNSCVVANNITN